MERYRATKQDACAGAGAVVYTRCMKPGLWRYVKAAFSARPLGMFVAPNWIAITAFGLLGLLSPGFWLVGAGLELAYIFALVQSSRFRQYVDSLDTKGELATWQGRVNDALKRLNEDNRARFTRLSERCQQILDAQPEERAGVDVQSGELSRLLWLFLKLLRSRQTFEDLLREARQSGQDQRSLSHRASALERDLALAGSDEVKRSLSAQLDIVRQRLTRQGEAQNKLVHVEADLERIEQQVELLREETMLTTNTETVSRRIEAVSSGLNETVQWVKEQEELHGEMDDLLDEAPQMLAPMQAGRPQGPRR